MAKKAQKARRKQRSSLHFYTTCIYDGEPGYEVELTALLDNPVPVQVGLPFTIHELLGTRVVFTATDGKRYVKSAQAWLDGLVVLFIRLAASDEEEQRNAEEREADIVFPKGTMPVLKSIN